ncbi:MAG: ribonuclease HII [Blastochloris sp.]|nr:ribonuclease HII [Blastochloris sp.]
MIRSFSPPRDALSWDLEDQAVARGFIVIAGVDEAGRGCLAGPVVAAACVFQQRSIWPEGLNDSKKLSPARRKKIHDELTRSPAVSYAIAQAEPEEIDQINILQASLLAMTRAVRKLGNLPDYHLIDGPQLPLDLHPAQAVIRGDALSPSIAAASILAKESRDRIMEQLDLEFPQYGFRKHKGYGTPAHLLALQTHGPCPQHRKSFAPVRAAA